MKNDKNDQELWSLLKGVSTDDKSDILTALGFTKKDVTKMAEDYTGKVNQKENV